MRYRYLQPNTSPPLKGSKSVWLKLMCSNKNVSEEGVLTFVNTSVCLSDSLTVHLLSTPLMNLQRLTVKLSIWQFSNVISHLGEREMKDLIFWNPPITVND